MKRKILVLCLSLALIFMAIAAPADATDIILDKDVMDPFNRFCVDETIHYEMLVENPDRPGVQQVDMIVNVYDEYPNGVTELLEEDLDLPFGENKTYYKSYVVGAGDVGTITNRLFVYVTPKVGGAFDPFWDEITKYSLILDPMTMIVEITKVASPTAGAPCTDVNFTITVTNTGDCTLDPVEVVDTLPVGMSYVSDDSGGIVSGQEITWDLGSMGSGDSTTILLVAHIDVGPAGTLSNNVVATGTPKDSICVDVSAH